MRLKLPSPAFFYLDLRPLKLRQPALHLVFAFLLLLSQQMGLAHAVLHLSSGAETSADSTSQDKQLPRETQCSKCFAYASIGSALTTPSASFFADFFVSRADRGVAVDQILPRVIRAFDSRAPPVVA